MSKEETVGVPEGYCIVLQPIDQLQQCELCEIRNQETKMLVRAARAREEHISAVETAHDRLAADCKYLFREVQILLGRMGRSADYQAALKAAGVDLEIVDGWVTLTPPDSLAKDGVVDRLVDWIKTRI